MAIKAYNTKKGKRYQVELYYQGQRVASKAGFLTKKEANTWLHQEERKWERYGSQAAPTRMTFEQLVNAYLTEMADRRKRNTYICKRGVYRRVLRFFNFNLLLTDINRATLTSYMQAQKKDRGSKAANRDLKELSIIFNWGIRRNHMLSNPTKQIEPYAEDSYVRYVPPPEDIEAVRNAATKEERQLIDTLYYTAARISELLNLTWDDVNFEARFIRLWTSKRRGGNREHRTLAMHENLYQLLYEMWQERDPDTPYVFVNSKTGTKHNRSNDFTRFLFRRVCARAGIENYFTAHSIRHYVATHLVNSRKATHRQIQQFLGHMNIRTTETYLHELQIDHDILNAFDEDE